MEALSDPVRNLGVGIVWPLIRSILWMILFMIILFGSILIGRGWGLLIGIMINLGLAQILWVTGKKRREYERRASDRLLGIDR